ncbi:MAG: 50S ribosomal protein L29 [Alphaproteobacteria bacterium]|nr:50S ribosomal protein L29 [Alphaproteobacteria bacterium]
MKKIKDLRSQKPGELTALETELKKESFNLRFQQAGGQLKNTARRRAVRREIAQIKTILAAQAKSKKGE